MENILIVENDEFIARVLASKLKTLYFKVDIASTMQEAQNLMEDKEFFASILNIDLPDSKKGEIVEYMLLEDIPSIVLSNKFNEEIYNKIIKKDIIDFIIKNREEDLDYIVKIVDNLSRYKYYKALVVDSDENSFKTIKKYLSILLFKVYRVKDTKEAFEFINENPDINLILINQETLSGDGFDLILKIRKKYKKFQKVIIGESLNNSKDISTKFLKYGANSYISKPFTREEFNYAIHNTMDSVEQVNKIKEQLDIIDKNINCSRTDLEGNITYVSEAFLKETGYSKDELMGKNHNILRHPDMPSEIYEDLWESIKVGKTWFGEIKNRKKNGDAYWVSVQIEPIFDRSDNIIGYNAIRRNITDQKQKERQEKFLLQQSRMSAMGEMLNLISHHWRQPLNVVAVVLQDIQASLITDEISKEDTVKEIERVLEHVYDMSANISYFTTYFQMKDNQQITTLSKVMKDILFIIEPSFEKNLIKYSIELQSDNQIYIYKNEFTQSIINILKNSLEAFSLRKINEPEIKIKGYEEVGFEVLEISDNGGGINEIFLPKIFEPYFSTKDELNGTGLGLYITKTMIEEHLKGKVTVKNIENGVKFIVKIPRI